MGTKAFGRDAKGRGKRLKIPGSLKKKEEKTRQILRKMESLLVGFSGGADSTLLLRLAHEELGDRVVALIASSPTYPASEVKEAKRLAESMGVRHVEIFSNELKLAPFVQNTPRRCYYCKTELFRLCREKANSLGLKFVADGSNLDDTGDFRPGMDAARELGVRSPLQEAGLKKEEIRQLSRSLGLPTWDKPSLACLASRFPYGREITSPRLAQVQKSEEFLRSLGLRQVRVRFHDKIARVEIEARDFKRFLGNGIRRKVTQALKEFGFTYVTIDLEGYRTGSMNEELSRKGKEILANGKKSAGKRIDPENS